MELLSKMYIAFPDLLASIGLAVTLVGGLIIAYVRLTNRMQHIETSLNDLRKQIERDRAEDSFSRDKTQLLGENVAELRQMLRTELDYLKETVKELKQTVKELKRT